MSSIYLDILQESFFASIFISFDAQFLVFAAAEFPEENNIYKIFIHFMLGGVAALSLNYAVGWLISGSLIRSKDNKENYGKLQKFYYKYLIWLLLLTCFNFIGGPLTVFAGILKTRLAIFFALIIASKTAYFMLFIL